MFNRCVQTNTGKLIVRSHEVDFDVQAVYSKLVHIAKKSEQPGAYTLYQTSATTWRIPKPWYTA